MRLAGPVLFVASTCFAQPILDASGNSARIEVARQLIGHLSRGEFAGAAQSFDKTMSAALPPAKLEQTWAAIEAQAGAFRSIQGARVQPVAAYFAVLASCKFERTVLTAKVVLDAQNKVAGLFFLPGEQAASDWTPPDYAAAKRFHEKEVSVGAAHLPGHLTLPKGKGPFPALVLVHGSGPNDQDETLGPNKIFRDLAYGLASKGVAVLRYDKRTRVAPGGVVTVRDEVLDDAVAAVALLRHESEVNPKKIYVLGHSLGGYLMPWFARDNPGVAGVILMAGSARPLMDVLVEQYGYFLSLDPNNPAVTKGLEEAQQMRARVDSKDLKPDEEIFHAKGAYWLGLRDYRPVEVAAHLTTPMLILQGERDYQVSAERDFGAFKKGLEGHKNATLKTYPALNHLFIAGEGKSTPQEYERPGHVDVAVLNDIAAWISKARP